MSEYVGLDVSLEETSVCVLDVAGSVVWEGKVESEPAAIERLLRRRAPLDQKNQARVRVGSLQTRYKTRQCS